MSNLVSLSNEELLARLPLLRSKERNATAEVIVYLAEVDRRRLYLGAACSSLYSFCVERLGYSEDAAMKRMRVARLYRELPQVLDELESGAIHLTGLFQLSNRLTADNIDELLAETRGKTRREIEQVLARWFPKSDVLPMVVPLGVEPGALAGTIACPETGEVVACSGSGGVVACLGNSETGEAIACPGTGEMVARPGNFETGEAITCSGTGEADGSLTSRPARSGPLARVQPLSAQSYRVEFTASAELHAKLEHAQALLSHAVAPGALPEIFERALDALIVTETKRRQGVERKKLDLKQDFAQVTSGMARMRKEPKSDCKSEVVPARHSRHVPVQVAREVYSRDGYQCTFVDELGRRCGEKRFLTLEHRDPYARGGPASVENLCILCKAHKNMRRDASLETPIFNANSARRRPTRKCPALWLPKDFRARKRAQRWTLCVSGEPHRSCEASCGRRLRYSALKGCARPQGLAAKSAVRSRADADSLSNLLVAVLAGAGAAAARGAALLPMPDAGSTLVGMSGDRRIILERRRRFLAAALATAGAAGVAQGCADKQTQPQVCLSQGYDDRPQVCLEPMIEDDAGPPPQPCLSPMPDDPEPQVCLSIEAPDEGEFAKPPPDDEG